MKIADLETHYRENRNTLVKRMKGRVPNNSEALAEEVVQEAYTRAFKYFSTYKPKNNNFEDWFYRILLNCVSDCRSEEADRGVVRDKQEEEEVYFEGKLNQDMLIHIQNTIDSYEPEEKKIIQLYFFGGLTTKSIAEHVARRHGAVRMVISKFGKNMREEN